MPAWFGRQRDVKPTIDSLRFDTAGWTYRGEREPGRMRVWETPDHDGVSRHFFNKAPDLPKVKTVAEIRAFYIAQLGTSKAKAIQCEVSNVARCTAVWLLINAPQQPHGMLYQGVLTLPFRDFSYVIKVPCPESGTTGIRETMLMERRMHAGEVPNMSGVGPIFPGWNPDLPEYDADFPTHPLSRLRRLVPRIVNSALLDEPVRRAPPLPLPNRGE
jgi:hypothetical protein